MSKSVEIILALGFLKVVDDHLKINYKNRLFFKLELEVANSTVFDNEPIGGKKYTVKSDLIAVPLRVSTSHIYAVSDKVARRQLTHHSKKNTT